MGVQRYKESIKRLFEEADSDGNGKLSVDEFLDLSDDTRIIHWLAAMGLDVGDARLVWELVAGTSSATAELDAEDLVQGIAKLKGPAKSLDMMNIMREVTQIRKGMVMVSPQVDPQCCYEFEGEILVLHHPTTISTKYQGNHKSQYQVWQRQKPSGI